MSQFNQLKHSATADFTTTPSGVIVRERSFVKPGIAKDVMKRRSQTMSVIKTKPSVEIYRPPNVRPSDIANNKLNVHAKEFTMNRELQASKSSGNLAGVQFANSVDKQRPLLHSKSSGNVIKTIGAHHHHHHPGLVLPVVPMPYPPPGYLQPARLTLYEPQTTTGELYGNAVFPGMGVPQPHWQPQWNGGVSSAKVQLKRSKSLGAADAQALQQQHPLTLPADTELRIFTALDRQSIAQALEDPNQLSSRALMDLVRAILQTVTESIRHCEIGAKLCVAIAEREHGGQHTFLEALLNTCQQWYAERERMLKQQDGGGRFTAFMWFLTEMYGQLKRHRGRLREAESLRPDLVILQVLARCCQACVSAPGRRAAEKECLFFVLTSVGRDLDAELPQQLEELLGQLRDGFLTSAGSPALARTFLQLIELHASDWQLPASAVLYYYPRTS